MNKTQLAKNLDLSRTMVYRLEKRDMPTNEGIEAAIEWRKQNLDVTQTKGWRIDRNPGIKHKPVEVDDFIPDLPSNDFEREVLTDVMPEIWFDQVGWLGSVLKDHDVKITAEQLIKVQQMLFMIYTEAATEYLELEEDELFFKVSPILKAMPGDNIYPSLIVRLNQILST